MDLCAYATSEGLRSPGLRPEIVSTQTVQGMAYSNECWIEAEIEVTTLRTSKRVRREQRTLAGACGTRKNFRTSGIPIYEAWCSGTLITNQNQSSEIKPTRESTPTDSPVVLAVIELIGQ